MTASAKRLQVCLILVAWCVALLAARVWRSGDLTYAFLIWNLGLAVVPALAALLFGALSQARTRLPSFAAFVVWLCFLPNAPYIVTDFVHLRSRPPLPVWFDFVLLASYAATGLLLGYASVADVQVALARRYGPRLSAWVASGSLFLCGFGVYLGRVLRWNSWDIVTAPLPLARVIAHRLVDPLAHPMMLAVSVSYGMALVLGYTVLRKVASPLSVDVQP